MKIVETLTTDRFIQLKLAGDVHQPEHDQELLHLRFRWPVDPVENSVPTVQLTALRLAQDAIVAEIRRLSGR
jgi:hypothetical protein